MRVSVLESGHKNISLTVFLNIKLNALLCAVCVLEYKLTVRFVRFRCQRACRRIIRYCYLDFIARRFLSCYVIGQIRQIFCYRQIQNVLIVLIQQICYVNVSVLRCPVLLLRIAGRSKIIA